MPQPSKADLRRFCDIDGWEETTAGRRGPDHTRYRKQLPDGKILRTRVSHGRGNIEDPRLWNRIWRHQLRLDSEDPFWEALRTGRPVDRKPPQPQPRAPTGESKPGWLVNSLISIVEVDAVEVAAMSGEEAMDRWIRFCEEE